MRAFPISMQTVALLALSGAAMAQQTPGLSGLSDSITTICGTFMTILPPLAILLVVVGAVFFGSGKLMPNAEFGNKATNMAAGALVGAVMCLVIVLLVPSILQSLYGGSFSCGTQVWG